VGLKFRYWRRADTNKLGNDREVRSKVFQFLIWIFRWLDNVSFNYCTRAEE